MKSFKVAPEIKLCDSFSEFIAEFSVDEKDLIVTDQFLYNAYIAPALPGCNAIVQDAFGGGEPTDTKLKAILNEAKKYEFQRIIAIGGGTAIDISKIIALSGTDDLIGLFTGKIPPVREKELIIIPTTCGTGSEITNISIVAFEELNTKLGLANNALFADYAVLIPTFLENLPYKIFVFSSVDALIHAIESYLSPKANAITRFFSEEAILRILDGYVAIAQKGKDYRREIISDFLLASTYAGIAFSNAGCGLVHAMSYPLSGEYHIAHGEANHKMLMSVLRFYNKAKGDGDIQSLYSIFAKALNCDKSVAFAEFEKLFASLIENTPLASYGATEETLRIFAAQVIKTQQRLLGNAYVPTSESDMFEIYKTVL